MKGTSSKSQGGRMHSLILSVAILLSIFSSTALAETIANRFGATGRVGFAVPLKDDFINGTSDTKAGVAWSGGIIYGFNDYLASEVEVSYLPRLDVEINDVKTYEAKLTDIAISLQYRFTPKSSVVPYIGAGVDFIRGDLDHVNGTNYDLDWTTGGHVNVGLDWFLTKGIALTADLRGTIAASGDILNGSSKVGEYDPYWFQGTFGIRLFLPAIPY